MWAFWFALGFATGHGDDVFSLSFCGGKDFGRVHPQTFEITLSSLGLGLRYLPTQVPGELLQGRYLLLNLSDVVIDAGAVVTPHRMGETTGRAGGVVEEVESGLFVELAVRNVFCAHRWSPSSR